MMMSSHTLARFRKRIAEKNNKAYIVFYNDKTNNQVYMPTQHSNILNEWIMTIVRSPLALATATKDEMNNFYLKLNMKTTTKRKAQRRNT